MSRAFRFRYMNREKITHPIAQAIVNEDITALDNAFEQSWDPDTSFTLYEDSSFSVVPINLALSENCEKSIRWLLAKNVALNNIAGEPAIVIAGFSCSAEIIRLLVEHGANINARDNVGKSVLTTAMYGKRADVIDVLCELGFPVADDAHILRSVAFDGDAALAKKLLETGIDPNRHEPNMVFPYNPTAVCTAANAKKWDMVKLLIENGADVTIADEFGNRPYLCAERDNNAPMMATLKALEPPEWHDRKARIAYFQSLGLPDALIEMMGRPPEERTLTVKGENYQGMIKFNSLTCAKTVTWRKHEFVDLLAEVSGYDADGILVWSLSKKKLASADYEHDTFKVLGVWSTFEKTPDKIMDKSFTY